MNHLLLNILLALLWAAMAESFTAGSVASGFVLGFAALWMLQPIMGRSRYFKRSFATVRFISFMIAELVIANFVVAGRMLRPLRAMKPGIVAVPIETKTDLETTLLAICITMTPGSFAVDVSEDGRTLFVHVIDASDPDAIRAQLKSGFERRLLEVIR